MNPRRFLGAVEALLQPETPAPDPAVWDRLPQARLVSSLRGTVCRFEFPSDDELWIVLQVRPAGHLLLRPEDRMSRFLDTIGLSGEQKVGIPAFDARYRIQQITRGDARALFHSPARKLVEEMEPFHTLEMAERELRLLKPVDLQVYTPQQALTDLERLMTFHLVTMRIDLPDAGV